MKKTFMRKFLVIASVVFAFVLSSASCERSPDYLGTWVYVATNVTTGDTLFKDRMTFSENSVDNLVQSYDKANKSYIDWFWISVSFELDSTGTIMLNTVTDAGIAPWDSDKGLPTGEIALCNGDDDCIDQVLSQIQLDRSFSVEYEVIDNQMFTCIDWNHDEDCEEEDESVIYTRVD